MTKQTYKIEIPFEKINKISDMKYLKDAIVDGDKRCVIVEEEVDE